MRYLAILCLCGLLFGCAYVSKTVVTMKAADVSAVSGAIPIGVKDGDVLFERSMNLHIFHNCKKD